MVDSGIQRGDVKMINEVNNYQVGDIIAFYYQSGDDQIILYHEIIEETADGGFITKGSSNALPEANVTYSDKIIGRQSNDGNYKILISVPFRISVVLIAYGLAMAYIIWYILDLFKEEREEEAEVSTPIKSQYFTCPSGNKKLRKKRRRSKGWKTLTMIGLLFISTCGFTYSGVYSASQPLIAAANNISFAATIKGWTNSDILSDEFYEAAEDLEYALSNPSSTSGIALSDAIAAKKSADWIGNMDKITQVSGNLEDVMTVSSGTTYILKICSNGNYELYMTSVNYKNKSIYSTISPVYKTTYELQSDGTYKAVQSEVGSCQVTYYDSSHGQWQKSFNTDSFDKS